VPLRDQTTTPEQRQELSRLDRYAAELRELLARYQALSDYLIANEAVAKADPEDARDYERLMQESSTISRAVTTANNAILGVQATIDRMGEWFGDFFTLGALPVVPIAAASAAISVAIAATTKWITDAANLRAKIEERKRLIAEGATPEEAARAQREGGSLAAVTGDLRGVVQIAAIGFAAWFLGRMAGFIK
jgi:hypothetical protein